MASNFFNSQENPFESPNTSNGPGASGSAFTPFTPSKFRADELQASAQALLDMSEYLRKLERRQIAAEKSIEAKVNRIKELEEQKRE